MAKEETNAGATSFKAPKAFNGAFSISVITFVPETKSAKSSYEIWATHERTNVTERLIVNTTLAQRCGLDKLNLAEADEAPIFYCEYERRIKGVTGYRNAEGEVKLHTSDTNSVNRCSIGQRVFTAEDEIRIRAGRFTHVAEHEVAEMTD